MSAKFHQISLKETFSECQDLFTDDAPSFFQLLDEHLDLESFIPDSFFNAFYRSLGRKRLYPLSGFWLPSSFRRFFPFLQIPCLSFFLISVRNFAIFAASIRFRMLRCLHASNRIFFRLLKKCSISLLILPSPSVWPLILHWLRCSPLILPGLNSTSPKTIPRPSTPSSAD